MTRKEQIEKAAEHYYQEQLQFHPDDVDFCNSLHDGFLDGALWADTYPKDALAAAKEKLDSLQKDLKLCPNCSWAYSLAKDGK